MYVSHIVMFFIRIRYMAQFEIKQIGIIHSPFKQASGTPIQAATAKGAKGYVEIYEQYIDGLKDIEGFERIWLLYWFDRASEMKLHVKPYLDTEKHGVFATRAPSRPNPIGISSVGLLAIEDNVLRITDVDILDGTPLLDIKPYASKFDHFEVSRCGWLDNDVDHNIKADDRFEK